MSSLHSGLNIDEKLRFTFSDARKGQLRIVVVKIVDEELSLFYSQHPNLEWDKEYDQLIVPHLKGSEPHYIFYRLDVKNSLGHYQWLFLFFSPDIATSRQKMLYSSSRSIIRKEFGSDYIKAEIFGTEIDELTLEGYYSYLASKEAPNPLTEEEMVQNNMEIQGAGTQDRSSHIGGLNFPIQQEFWALLRKFMENTINYIETSIDVSNENILISGSGIKSPSELKQLFPPNSPRYYLYRFKHAYEGVSDKPILFLYYSPGYISSIKERMLYSSSIAGFLTQIEDKGVVVSKRIELDNEDDFSDKFLIEEIHPPKVAPVNAFSKPKPPHRNKHSQGVRPKVVDNAPEFGEFYNVDS